MNTAFAIVCMRFLVPAIRTRRPIMARLATLFERSIKPREERLGRHGPSAMPSA